MNYLIIIMSASVSDKAFNPYLNSPGLKRPYNIIVWLSLAIAAGLSLLDISGWIFNVTSFKNLLPEWETMRLITAICLFLSVISLAWIILYINVFAVRLIIQLFAFFISITGGLSVYCNLFHFFNGGESPITGMSLFSWALNPVTRMALLTAFNFMLTGSAVFLLTSEKKKASAIAHGVIVPVILVSYIAVISYIMGVRSATKFDDVAVAFNTGIAFCLLCITVLMMDRKTWLLRVFTSNDSGGIFARKFFPYILALPVVIGWLRIKGEKMEIFSSDRGVVYVAATYSLILAIIVWITARSVNSIDRKKNILARELHESEERFKVMAEAAPVAMGVEGISDSEVLYINPAYEQYFGYEKNDLLGKKSPDIYIDHKDRELILKKLRENNYVTDFEVKLKRKDGSSFWSYVDCKTYYFQQSESFPLHLY